MKGLYLKCDRCGSTVVIPWQLHIVEEYMPKALRHGSGPDSPPGWRELDDDERVEDVCPDCLTVVERAEEIVRGAEDVPF